MSAELLLDFEYRPLTTVGARLRVASAGDGPPLLLLHGYPQTHLAWHRIAPRLAERYRVVLADLRGYGDSRAQQPDAPGAYGKRALAEDARELMAQLGHERFAVIGHDRGARVGYRLALDHPHAVSAFVSLTVVPILDIWPTVNQAFALNAYHWFLLAQPFDLPERLIGAQPEWFLDYTLKRMAQQQDIYHPAALADYQRAFADPAVRHALCEDYRAAVGEDVEADRADRDAGRRLQCPVQVLWSERPYAQEQHPLTIWRRWAEQVEGAAIRAGHMLPEAAPDAVLEHVLPFLDRQLAPGAQWVGA
ncbi:alpha/beta fold hydrolase [Pseudomonas sp. LRF_L74]|uniref:alpha/beta fold hydrolase n=1 Tax=Pseudomonas sp. LRF_L74 TaxID=3369422 RepID=UPI003F61E586